MIAKPVSQALERWRRRLGTSFFDGLADQPWATSADVRVRWREDQGHGHLWVGDATDPGPAGDPALDWEELDVAEWSWQVLPVVQDGWLGNGTDGTCVLHLRLAGRPVSVVHCQWARASSRPLMVHLHLPANRTLEWFDETVPSVLQRTVRAWHLADEARLRLTNVLGHAAPGCSWWDDAWLLAAGAQVAWVDQVGAAQDVRRRSQVSLQQDAVWRMATVGWLLPQRWHEHDLDVRHHGPRSESRLHHRTALLERTQRRMTSCVSVDPSAVDGLTEQTMQHWLLSDQVVLAASPQLAIGIGTLRGATHGAAVGRFDPLVVNAMRARGLPLDRALMLVLEGALTQALDLLDDGAPWWNVQRDVLHQRVAQGGWLNAAQAFWAHEQEYHDEQ